jgi:putative redox protein
MGAIKTARVTYTSGLRFTAEAGSGHHLVMGDPDDGSDDSSGFSPMELPLVALAGCMGMDVVSIIRKQRQDLTGYDMAVRGERADEHPKVFTQITVEHTFTGRGLRRDMVERAIELSRTRYCSVNAMLAPTVAITHTVTLVEADAPA